MKNVFYYEHGCIYCNILRDYLIENKIIFNEINIIDAPRHIKDFNEVPIIDTGNIIIVGLDWIRINKYFNIKDTLHKYIYLDNASTTNIKSEVIDAMKPYISKKFFNASSKYSPAIENKLIIDDCRRKISNLLNCRYNELFFTSGGSESNNTILKGIALANKNKGNHIIISSIEHSSILKTCEFLETIGYVVTRIPVDNNGIIKLDELKSAITEETILISVMFANNEIGTIQPIKQISQIAHEKNILFHTDAVQAIGFIPIDIKKYDIDLLSFSGHKIHGPKGVGAMYIKSGINVIPLIHGGNQENGLRAGTESVANIVGLTKAIEVALKNIKCNNGRLINLRNKFIKELINNFPNIKLNGHPEIRLPGNVNVSFDINSEILKSMLDIEKIYVSSGSACSENNLLPSHVLKEIGLDDTLARCSIRFSLSYDTTENDISRTILVLNKIVNKVYRY